MLFFTSQGVIPVQRLPGGPGLRSPAHGAWMAPERLIRAALEPKSAVLSWLTNDIAPPPGTGRPVPANWIG
jgi:hypothetical protein